MDIGRPQIINTISKTVFVNDESYVTVQVPVEQRLTCTGFSHLKCTEVKRGGKEYF